MRKIRFMFFMTLIPFFLLVACGQEKSSVNRVISKYGGTLYYGVETPFHSFDVLNSGGLLIPSMSTLINLIQEPLFRMDGEGNLVPVLGLSATASDDGKTWEIKLREGVRFHDGEAFNADAVIHHWERMLLPANKYRGRRLFEPITSIEKVDDYRVRFHLRHPWPTFLRVMSDELYLCAFIPSPKAVKDGVHDMKPVGTGPFTFNQWNSGIHFIVTKNENYWQKDRPFLNKIVFRIIPDHQTRFASLMAGEIDAISIDRGNLIRRAEKDPDLFVYKIGGNGAEIVMVNTEQPPLDDIRIRRALALANDQGLHVKVVYSDSIPMVHHPYGASFNCWDDGYLEQGVDAARKLITEFGKPVELELLHTNTSRGRQTGELMQQLYKKIGVKLNPIPVSTAPHVMRVVQKDYQLATWRIPSSLDHGPQLYRSLNSQSPANYTGYKNPVMDEMLELQRQETDLEKRKMLMCRIAVLINQDVPFIYRGGRRYHIIARKKIAGLVDNSGVKLNLASAWIDDPVNFNPLAYEIEQKSAVAFDCPDPGDTDALKAVLIGDWHGQDDWGAAITASFFSDDRVISQRKGSNQRENNYTICGSKIFWKAGDAKVLVTLSEGKIDGYWEKAGYKGNFVLEQDQDSENKTQKGG